MTVDRARRNRMPTVTLVALGLLSLMRAPASAQPSLTLGLTSSQAIYHAGETLQLTTAALNAGSPDSCDLYLVVVLPDGSVLSFTSGGVAVGSFTDLAGLTPLAAGVDLARPFRSTANPFLEYRWSGDEALGSYRFYYFAVRAGALADGWLQEGELLALDTLAVTLARPVTAELDLARGTGARITANGGRVTAKGSDGTTYVLTVPPGAFLGAADIALTPVNSLTDLPFSGRLLGAVRLEPAGLHFVRPALLTMSLAEPPDPAGLLGFIFDGSGANLEALRASVAGTEVTVEISHFSTAGAVGGTVQDFIDQARTAIQALPGFLPPAQVEDLLALLLAWWGSLGSEVCPGSPLCQEIIDKAIESLTNHLYDTCFEAEKAVGRGDANTAFDLLRPIAALASRIVEVRDLATSVGLTGLDVAGPDLQCVGHVLGGIVAVAEKDVSEKRATVVIGSDPPQVLAESSLLLLREGLATASLLEFFDTKKAAEAALVKALEEDMLAYWLPLCDSDPDTEAADAVLHRMVQLFDPGIMDGLKSGLGDRYLDAEAGCTVRIEPVDPTVKPEGRVQLTARFFDSFPDPRAFTWTMVDSCKSGIGPRGLFTAGTTAEDCTVLAETGRFVFGVDRLYYKKAVVSVVSCDASAPLDVDRRGARRAAADTCAPGVRGSTLDISYTGFFTDSDHYEDHAPAVPATEQLEVFLNDLGCDCDVLMHIDRNIVFDPVTGEGSLGVNFQTGVATHQTATMAATAAIEFTVGVPTAYELATLFSSTLFGSGDSSSSQVVLSGQSPIVTRSLVGIVGDTSVFITDSGVLPPGSYRLRLDTHGAILNRAPIGGGGTQGGVGLTLKPAP